LQPHKMKKEKSRLKLIITASVLAGIVLTVALEAGYRYTSRNDCCMSCHFHEDADKAWKKSVHCNNESGTITDCAACHLPPEGSLKHFIAKARFGIKDIWSFITKKKEDIDWASKGELEYAKGIVSNESCMKCHVNVIPAGLSNEGITAHLHFEEHYKDLDLSCISCHLDAGHFNPNYSHAEMTGIPRTAAKGPVFETPCPIESFANYTETIPDTRISINMIAIPGGEFTMGSPENEKGRKPDEGPQARVKLSRFFMAETEISWDQFWAFYAETMSEGRTPPEKIYANNTREDIDAVSGIVDKSTGAVRMRARFANPDHLLRSGGNANVIIPTEIQNCIQIPQAATYEIQERTFVYKVVDGKAVSTRVSVYKYNDGSNYIVESGLEEGDIVIAEGAGLVKEGTTVKTEQE